MTPGDLLPLASDCALVSRWAVAAAFVVFGLAVALNHWAAWLLAAAILANLSIVVGRLP